MENYLYFDLTKDVHFKATFGAETEYSKIALASLLSSILDKQIKDLTLINNEPTSNNIKTKDIRMDIVARLEDESVINIEMQMYNNWKQLPNRMLYYATKLFMAQDAKGKHYDQFQNVYSIFIVGFDFDEGKEYLHQYQMREKNGKPLERIPHIDSLIQIYVVELTKVEVVEIDQMTMLEKWIYVLKNYSNPKKQDIIKKVKAGVEGFRMLDKQVNSFDQEEIDRINRIFDEKAELESSEGFGYRIGKSQGYKEGKAQGKYEGMLEGRVEGKLEERNNLLQKMIMKKLPKELILDMGYTLEEIDALQIKD